MPAIQSVLNSLRPASDRSTEAALAKHLRTRSAGIALTNQSASTGGVCALRVAAPARR